jgi:hypothetical protein
MADTIRDLFVGLGVKTDTDKLDRFDKGIESVKKGMASALGVAVKLTAGLAAMVGIQGFSAAKMADTNLEILRQADALGITNERYQTLMHTFEAFGADANDIADAINTITDRANDAVGGVKSMADDFGLLGIKVAELKNKKPEALFDLFVEKLGETEDIAKRNTAVVRILGDDVGRKLLPVLKDGGKTLKQYATELKAMGVIMSDDAIKKTSDYATQNKRLQLTLTGIRNTIALAIIPSLTKATKGTTDWILANKPIIDKKISNGLRDVRDVLDRVDKMLERVGGGNREEGIKRVGGALSALAIGGGLVKLIPILSGILSVGLIPLLVIGLKIAAVVAIVVALGLAIEDLIIYFRGGPSVTAKMIKAVQAFFTNLRAGNETVDSIITTLEDMGQIAMLVFGLIERVAMAVFSRIAPFAQLVFEQIAAAATFVYESISAVFTALWENIVSPIFTAIGTLFGVTVGVLLQELDYLLENWDLIFGGLGETVDMVLGGILTVWKAIFGFMGTAASEMLGSIRDLLIDILGFVGKAFKGLAKIGEVLPDADRGFLGRFISEASGGDTGALNQIAVQQAGATAAANAGRGMGNANFNSTYNVNAAPGMDERKLARNVSDLTRQDQQNQARQLRTRASKER